MAANRYTAFFAAFNASVRAGNSRTKEEVVSEFTNDRSDSLKDLTDKELKELVAILNKAAQFSPKAKPTETNTKGEKMRRAIIAIFYQMGRTAEDAKRWCENQGVKGEKKKFNAYTNDELYTLIRIAEKVLSDWKESVRKKFKDL